MINPNVFDAETRRLMELKVAAAFWKRGHLRYKLKPSQKKIVEALETAGTRKFFLLCARRFGKSYTLLLLAFERAIQHPGSRVLFLAPYAKDAANIATDVAQYLMADCPDSLKPHYNAQDKVFTFKRPGQPDSIIRLAGINSEQGQYLRGGSADVVILDECALMDNLKTIVSSVVTPMTLTTNGRIFFATTPPMSPGHDSATIYEQMAGENAAISFNILQNDVVSFEQKVEGLVETGETRLDAHEILHGRMQPKATATRREYFCEFVTEATSAVLPEFTTEAREAIIRSSKRPAYYDAYTSMDPGMRDRTGILYAYFDFRRNKLVIEGETLLQMPSTVRIAEEIRNKEFSLWDGQEPYLRVSDVELRLIKDLHEQHGLRFIKAQKEDSVGAINLVRNMIQTRQLEINPQCVNLIRQMQNATWNRKGTDFVNSGIDSLDGHYDLVAALKYLCRHVSRKRNPYPDGFVEVGERDRFVSPRRGRKNAKKSLGLLLDTPLTRKMAGIKPKKRN